MDIDDARQLIARIDNWNSLRYANNVLNFSNNVCYELNLVRTSIASFVNNFPDNNTEDYDDFIGLQRDVWLMALNSTPIAINNEGRTILNSRVERYREKQGIV